MAKGQAIVKSEPKSVIVTGDEVPEYIKQGKGRGSENVTTSDIAIPRLEVIQGLSPVVKRGDPKFDKNARIGELMNSVSREMYGEKVTVVPVYYIKQYLVWKMRKWIDDKGQERTGEGGFLGSYDTEEEANRRADKEAEQSDSPLEIIDTPQHLCLLLHDDGRMEEVILSMPRTKAKISRQWNAMVRIAGGDRFGRAYTVSTNLEKNQKGDFYNYAVALAGFPSKEVYEKAEELYEAVSSGSRTVRMDASDLDEDGGFVGRGNSEM